MSADEDEDGGGEVSYTTVKNKNVDAYANLPRGLTPEELSQSGTQKMILSDLTKAETTIQTLKPFQQKYYDMSTQKCVLEEKLSKTKKAEILYSFCITGGGLIIGLGKSALATDNTNGIIQIVFGSLLLVGGLLFKIVGSK